ncbi:hypothetical protein HDU67_009092, partial [Dinochytrium kinnereticum]
FEYIASTGHTSALTRLFTILESRIPHNPLTLLRLLTRLLPSATTSGNPETLTFLLTTLQKILTTTPHLLPTHLPLITQPLNASFLQAVEQGHTETTRLLLTHDLVDPSAADSWALVKACMRGHEAIVDLLLSSPKRIDPTAHRDLAIISAAGSGSVGIVRRLVGIPEVNPGADSNRAFQLACQGGFLEVLEVLVGTGRVTPRQGISFSLWRCAENGHLEVLRGVGGGEDEGTGSSSSSLSSSGTRLSRKIFGETCDDTLIHRRVAEITLAGAARRGHLSILLLLLDRLSAVLTVEGEDEAICAASEFGHVDVVKALVGRRAVRGGRTRVDGRLVRLVRPPDDGVHCGRVGKGGRSSGGIMGEGCLLPDWLEEKGKEKVGEATPTSMPHSRLEETEDETRRPAVFDMTALGNRPLLLAASGGHVAVVQFLLDLLPGTSFSLDQAGDAVLAAVSVGGLPPTARTGETPSLPSLSGEGMARASLAACLVMGDREREEDVCGWFCFDGGSCLCGGGGVEWMRGKMFRGLDASDLSNAGTDEREGERESGEEAMRRSEVVRIVVERVGRVEVEWDHTAMIKEASRGGLFGAVEVLVGGRVDPSVDCDYALRVACLYGHLKVVRCLLACEKVDPGSCRGQGLAFAAAKGFRSIVRCLLEGLMERWGRRLERIPFEHDPSTTHPSSSSTPMKRWLDPSTRMVVTSMVDTMALSVVVASEGGHVGLLMDLVMVLEALRVLPCVPEWVVDEVWERFGGGAGGDGDGFRGKVNRFRDRITRRVPPHPDGSHPTCTTQVAHLARQSLVKAIVNGRRGVVRVLMVVFRSCPAVMEEEEEEEEEKGELTSSGGVRHGGVPRFLSPYDGVMGRCGAGIVWDLVRFGVWSGFVVGEEVGRVVKGLGEEQR